jgi:hypothetical protein
LGLDYAVVRFIDINIPSYYSYTVYITFLPCFITKS